MTEPMIDLSDAGPGNDEDLEASQPTVHDFDAAGRLAVGWLWDSGENRVLVLTGPTDGRGDDGSTQMAATLAELAPDLPERSRLHAQASARGVNTRVLTWMLAAQLDVCANTPGHLVTRLAADPRPVTLLVAELDASAPGQLGWETRAIVDDLLRPLLAVPGLRLVVQTAYPGLFGTGVDVLPIAPYPGTGPGPRAGLSVLGDTTVQDALMGGRLVDLCSDPRTAAEANLTTLAVAATTVLEHLPDRRRVQIDTFGQGLVTTEHPFNYVLHHAAALATGDEALRQALESHISHLPMRAAWARWRPVPGSVTGDWPGPVATLAAREGDAREFLMTDQTGRTHVLSLDDGTELGRVPGPRVPADVRSQLDGPKTVEQGSWQVSTSAGGTLVVRRRDFEGDVLNVNLGWIPTAVLVYEDGTVLVGGRHGLLCFRPVREG